MSTVDKSMIVKPCEKVVQHMQECEYQFANVLDEKIKLNDAQRIVAYNTFATPCARYLGLYLHHCIHNGAKLDEIAVERQTN